MDTKPISLHGGAQVTGLVVLSLLLAPVGTGGANAAVAPRPNTATWRNVELAAEVIPVKPSGPEDSGKATAPPKVDDPKAEGKLKQCKLQWTAADTNGDGILSGSKATRYNEMIRMSNQPVISEDARLTETDFMKACMAIAVHE